MTFGATLAPTDQVKRGFDGGADGVRNLQGVVKDIEVRLDGTFRVTKNQRVSTLVPYYHLYHQKLLTNVSYSQTNIRAIVKELMFEPTRVQFKTIYTDALVSQIVMHLPIADTYVTRQHQKRLRKEQVSLQLVNIFGTPSREKDLICELKGICSSIRNKFREAVSATPVLPPSD